MSRLSDERVREMLAAATPGPWEMDGDDLIGNGGMALVIDISDCEDAADAALIAAAPDLAADLLAARAEADALRKELAATRVSALAQADAATVLLVGQSALRAIIAGRTVAPTDAEIAAHATAGGAWLVSLGLYVETCNNAEFTLAVRASNPSARWWPLSATGEPCAWPVGGEGEG